MPNGYLEATISQVHEFDVLRTPDLIERAHRRVARFCLALFQFVDGPLGQANTQTKLTLAPT